MNLNQNSSSAWTTGAMIKIDQNSSPACTNGRSLDSGKDPWINGVLLARWVSGKPPRSNQVLGFRVSGFRVSEFRVLNLLPFPYPSLN